MSTRIKLFHEFHDVNETTFPRVARSISGMVESIDTIGIMTAENPMGEKRAEEQNEYAQNQLKKLLRDNNYGFHEVMGKYGNIENSLIIPNISKNLMIHLCQIFNQESVIWAEKTSENNMRFYYIEQDGEVKDVVDEVFLSSDVQKRNDFYTWVQGRKFYIPFFEEGPEQKKYKKFYKPLVYTRKEKHPTDLLNLDGDY
jgi:hypothetical protein